MTTKLQGNILNRIYRQKIKFKKYILNALIISKIENKILRKEEIKIYQQEYYINNKEKIKEISSLYNKNNKEKANKQRRKHYKNNPEGYKKRNKKYSQTKKGKILKRLQCIKYKAKKKNVYNDNTIIKENIDLLINIQKGKCNICRRVIDNYEIDHIHPISKGGANSIHNIQLLCRGCNRSKSNKWDGQLNIFQ